MGTNLSIHQRNYDNHILLFPESSRHLTQLIQPEWFTVEYWKVSNGITGKSHGRHITWFIEYEQDEWVLRHYYRGGMIARLSNDSYLYTGIKNTRAFQELYLLDQMHRQGLPVPQPIAARITRQKLVYRADLLMQKIPNGHDLVALLLKEPLREAEWRSIGAMIAKFHSSGIYHSDLNSHNILLDKDNEPWLIDFDKCEKRRPEEQWQHANLTRLKRSLNKEKNKNSDLHFDATNWHWLLQSYHYHTNPND